MATVLVSAAVLVEQGRVLVTRRPRGSHLEDLWEFPGGKVEEGEDPAMTVVREVREELGIDVTVLQVLEVTFWRYPNKDVLLLFYRVKRDDPRQEIQHIGVAGHQWCTADELDRTAMPPADVPVVARVRALLEPTLD